MPDIRYFGRFGSADGSVCQVWIRDNTFDGARTEFPLQSIKKATGRRGSHLFTPILGSYIELVGYETPQGMFDELFLADFGRFTAEVWRGPTHAAIEADEGDLLFKGIVQTDLGEADTVSAVNTLSISAVDGLGVLRDVPFMNTEGETPAPYEGRMTFLEVFRVCLEKIGFVLPIEVSGVWYPDAGEEGDILWAHSQADPIVFYDENGRAASCYEVMKQLLYVFTGRLFQRNGRWVIIQKEQIGAGSYTTHIYDTEGEYEGEGEMGEMKVASTGSREMGTKSFRTGFSSATAIYAHGNLPNLLRAGDFAETPLVDPAEVWEFGIAGGEFRTAGGFKVESVYDATGRLVGKNKVRLSSIPVAFIPAFFFGVNEEFSVFRLAIKGSNRYITQIGDEVQEGDVIALSGRFRIPYNEGGGFGLFNTFFELQVGTDDDGYMSRFGEWYEPSGNDDLQPLVSEGTKWNSTGFNLSRDPSEGWYDFTIVSKPCPKTGPVRLVLYGTADINGSDMDPEGVEWADIGVYVVDVEGELRDSLEFTASNGTKEPADETITLVIGQGPRASSPGRITWV